MQDTAKGPMGLGGQHASSPTLPSSPFESSSGAAAAPPAADAAAALEPQRSLGRAGTGTALGSSPVISLESVLSYLTPDELRGPSEVRTLLPGVDLREHGVGEVELAGAGGELPVLRAPLGLSLRDALSRLSSADSGREPSFTKAGRHTGLGSPTQQLQPAASTPAGTPTVPLTGLSPQVPPPPGRLAPPAMGRPPRAPAAAARDAASMQPPGQPSPPGSPTAATAAAWQHMQGAFEEAAGVTSRESSSKENQALGGQQQQQRQQPEKPPFTVPQLAAGSLALLEETGRVGPELGQSASEPPQRTISDLPQAARQQRPWTVDGAPGSLPVAAEAQASSLDAQWRARSALRMWAMLAPFVPRLLRDDILAPSPKCRSIYDIMQAADEPSAPDKPPAAMKPCVEMLPAAVMIADITGFTALTEALSTKGSAGVELLTKCMNRYFSQVIELLLQWRGDIMKFAGDSMIVAFWPTAEELDTPDGGLKAATLRAAACANELADKFGAMRMLSTGEAIPVLRAERATAAGAAAPEGEWFEDIVNRAQGFLVTGPEHLVETAFRPMAAFIQGAAKPMGAAFQGAAKPVGVVFQEAVKPVGTALHSTAGSVSIAVSKGSASALARGTSLAASASSRLSSRQKRSLTGGSASLPASSPTQIKRSRSAGASQELELEGEGAETIAEEPGEGEEGLDAGADAGAEQQMEGADVGGAPRRRRPLAHSRSIASGLVNKLTHAAAAPIGNIRGVRRSHSDAAELAAMLAAQQDGAAAAPGAGEVLGGTLLHQPSLKGFSRATPLSVRPPELPHRGDEQSRSGAAPDGAAAEGPPPAMPKPVLRTTTAPPDILSDLADHATPRTQQQSDGGRQAAHSPGRSGGHPPALATVSQANSDAAPSPSGGSFASSVSFFQPGQADQGQCFQGLPPIKTRVTEDPEHEGYEVVTVTAASGLQTPSVAGATPTSTPPFATAGQGLSMPPGKSDGFPWSRKFGKLLKKAKKAPKNLWHMSMGKPGAGGGGGKQAAFPDHRAASNLSVASGISNLESLTMLSRRVWSTAGQQSFSPSRTGGSPVATPSRRFLRRRHASSQQQGGSLSMSSPSMKEDTRLLLSLKVLVGAGTVCAFHVGGGQQSSVADPHGTPRWEFFIGDPPHAPSASGQDRRGPIAQLADIESLARAGEVVLSEEVADLLGDSCQVEPLASRTALLLKVNDRPSLPEDILDRGTQELSALAALPEAMQGQALQVLRMHLLESVRLRIEAGHIDYVNEIRACTILFLGFPSLNRLMEEAPARPPVAAAEAQLAKVQEAVEVVQRKMRQYDGSFVQFRSDEKGFLAICAFGLPGRSHEDGAARGVQAALSIVEAMRKRGGQAVVGVTTGQLFCAMVGSRRRLEYTVFGDAINLAARLMCKAKEGLAQALCDSTTQHLAQHKAYYRTLDPLRVKGKRLPVEIFAVSPLHAMQQPRLASPPRAEPQTGGDAASPPPAASAPMQLAELPRLMSTRYSALDEASAAASRPMIGRGPVLDAVVRRVGELVEQHKGGIILIEGDPGMGKTRLVEELQHSELGGMYDRCNMFTGYGRTDRKSQSFYPWRRIFRELFVHDRAFGQLYCMRDANPQQQHVVITELGKRLKDVPGDYESWVHLLSDALDIPLSEFPVSPPHLEATFTMQSIAVAGEGGQHEAATPPAPPALPPLQSSMSPAHSRALRDDEREFVVDIERARSFATRIKRSASATLARAPPAQRLHTPTKLPPRPDTPISATGTGSSSRPSSAQSNGSCEGLQHAVLPQQGSGWSAHEQLARAYTARAIPALAGKATAPEKEISGHLKTKKVQELLVAIIRQFAEAYGPLILILEDLHFFDSSSWWLMGAALEDLPHNVLLVATSRPVFGTLRASLQQLATKEVLVKRIEGAYRRVLQTPSTLHITLQPLNVEETRQLISSLLGGVEVGSDIAQLIWEKSNGLPAFIEQLVVYLQSQLAQPQSNLAKQAAYGRSGSGGGGGGKGREGDGSLSAPDLVLHAMDAIRNTVTIHSTITDRVDRLRPEEQLMLKVASVVGLVVYADLLAMAHPQQPNMQQVESSLQGLAAANFMKQDPQEPTTWQFSQVLARDVVYDLIPVGQRREWHGRLAFVMEMLQCDHSLPASTIAYHWTAACKNVETSEWWRTMKAIEFWEKSALEAIGQATYADGLPLLQKAQDLATVLAEEFGMDEESVALQLKDSSAPQQANLGTLPSGLVDRPSGSSLESVRGSHDGGQPDAAAGATMPLVSRLRRVHWERCMAAMCIAAELSQQSLNQAMLHCMRALILLRVPMPWDKAYRKKRRWWHCSFDGCFVAGMCCFSASTSLLHGAEGATAGQGEGAAARRVGEQEMADMAWLSRPGTLLGSLEVPQALLVQKSQTADSTGLQLAAALNLVPMASVAGDLDEGGPPPAAEAADHVEWWSEAHLPSAAHLGEGGALGPPAGQPQQPPQQQQHQDQQQRQGPAAADSSAQQQLSLWTSLSFNLSSLVSPFASSSPLLESSSTSSVAPAGSASHQQPSPPAAGGPSRPKVAVLPATPEAPEGSAYAAGSEAARPPPPPAAPAAAAALPMPAAAAAVGPPQLVRPSLVGVQPTYRRLSLLYSQSIPSQWLRGQHSSINDAARPPADSLLTAPSGRPATGGRGRLSGEEALEAAVVLEILVTVLLMPEHLDLEALRYVMWVCKWLEGKRVHEGSLYYSAWLDCANALHHQRRQSRPGVFTLRPLTSLVNFVFVKSASMANGPSGQAL